MSQNSLTTRSIIIIGSGIIGLSVLCRLIEDIEKKKSTSICYKIHVVTRIDKKILSLKGDLDNVIFDQDLASVYAGAHQRPFPTEYASGNEKLTYQRRESLYTKETFDYFLNKLKNSKEWSYDDYETTIKFCRGYDLIDSSIEAYKNLNDGYNSNNLVNFTEQDKTLSELVVPSCIQEKLDMISSYDTYVVNTPRFMRFLYRSCCEKSDAISNIDLQFHFNHNVNFMEDVVSLSSTPKPVIINCSGKGELLWNSSNDSVVTSYFPIRGQTLLVSVPNTPKYQKFAENTITYQNGSKWSFVIQRPIPKKNKNFKKRLYFIIGGTKQIDCYDKNISNADINYVLNNAKEIFPNLFTDGDWILERVNVGFRPGSKVGSVVNLEHKASFHLKTYYPIINCYGFGGYGVECSFGAANHVMMLLNRAFREANL